MACTAHFNRAYVQTFLDNPEIDEYFHHCFDERKRRQGDKSRLTGFTSTYFPNTSAHARQPRGLCVWHPHSPTSTEAWRFFLVDKDAPGAVKDMLRRYYMRYSGPAGMTEQDDMENWLYATSASVGTIARRYPFNYQQSLHATRVNKPVPGKVSLQITEENARTFYQARRLYMRDATWGELLRGKNDETSLATDAE
jgi:Ring hydroxylating alpha subunit (catalytic domain)